MNTVEYSFKPNYTDYSTAMLVLKENGFNEPVLAALETLLNSKNTSEVNPGLSSKDLDLAIAKIDLKISNVQKEIQQVKFDLDLKISAVQKEIQQVKSDLDLKISNVQKEIVESRLATERQIANIHKDIQQSKADLELKIANVQIKLQKSLNMQIWKIVGLLTLLSPIYALLIGFMKKSIF